MHVAFVTSTPPVRRIQTRICGDVSGGWTSDVCIANCHFCWLTLTWNVFHKLRSGICGQLPEAIPPSIPPTGCGLALRSAIPTHENARFSLT